MVRTKNQDQEQNERYIRATISHFLSGKPTFVIRDESGQILAMAMDESVIKNTQDKIIERMGKYFEFEKMVMKLEKVE